MFAECYCIWKIGIILNIVLISLMLEKYGSIKVKDYKLSLVTNVY